jgi:hypothetical protein
MPFLIIFGTFFSNISSMDNAALTIEERAESLGCKTAKSGRASPFALPPSPK